MEPKYYHVYESPPNLRPCVTFCNKLDSYGEEFSAPCPMPKIEAHPLKAVRESLFCIFASTLHICRLSSPSTNQGCTMPW